jgi:hypothetical protein
MLNRVKPSYSIIQHPGKIGMCPLQNAGVANVTVLKMGLFEGA